MKFRANPDKKTGTMHPLAEYSSGILRRRFLVGETRVSLRSDGLIERVVRTLDTARQEVANREVHELRMLDRGSV
jgi:hypothetical protein